MAASASTSSHANKNYNYDAFLNHRGPDVKKTLASCLYRWLTRYGLQVFLDSQELEVGQDLDPQIEKAIASASLHVAIFSPRYAESRWCLDELLLMIESEKPIIPIFYKVKPADLRQAREHRGAYAAALEIHENKIASNGQPRQNSTTVGKWRNALFRAANIIGFDLDTFNEQAQEHRGAYAADLEMHENEIASNGQPRQNSTTVGKWRNALYRAANITGFDLDTLNGDEGELLDKVVECVLERVKRQYLFDVGKHTFGLDEKAQDFDRKVLSQQHGGRVQGVVIAGPEGAGKTTLATELFIRKRSNYNNSYFLFDVRRENSKSPLSSLQKKILKGLTGLNQDVDNDVQGKWMLQKYLPKSRVLLVLDDVDDADHVDALCPVDVLHRESLILITSRNRNVLKWSRIQESSIYDLSGLDEHHSRQLFCFYAFGQPHPKSGFEYLVHQFLKDCNGVPLYLKECGRLVSNNNNKSDWEDQLKKRRQTLHTDIPRGLQISSVIRNRAGSILDSVNTIGMRDHLRALGRNLLKYLELVPRPWSGIVELNGRIEEFNDLSHDVKKIVLHCSFAKCNNCNRRAMNLIAGVEGVESLSLNVKEMNVTVIGSLDPVTLKCLLRKIGSLELLSVGPLPRRRIEKFNDLSHDMTVDIMGNRRTYARKYDQKRDLEERREEIRQSRKRKLKALSNIEEENQPQAEIEADRDIPQNIEEENQPQAEIEAGRDVPQNIEEENQPHAKIKAG